MDSIFYMMIFALAALAVVDLVVGVSNDAVNFLNSAIGSKVANFKTILIIASIGILVGATFSSGMMEVARNCGFRRRITTDAYFSCVLRVCVHHARVHVACAMFLEAVQSRRPRRPRRLSSIPRWPTSHCGFSISL